MDQVTSGTSAGGRSGSAISSSFTSSAGMTSGSFEDDDDMSTTPSSDFEDASSGPNEAERRAALAAGMPAGDVKSSDTPVMAGKAGGSSSQLEVREAGFYDVGGGVFFCM